MADAEQVKVVVAQLDDLDADGKKKVAEQVEQRNLLPDLGGVTGPMVEKMTGSQVMVVIFANYIVWGAIFGVLLGLGVWLLVDQDQDVMAGTLIGAVLSVAGVGVATSEAPKDDKK